MALFTLIVAVRSEKSWHRLSQLNIKWTHTVELGREEEWGGGEGRGGGGGGGMRREGEGRDIANLHSLPV